MFPSMECDLQPFNSSDRDPFLIICKFLILRVIKVDLFQMRVWDEIRIALPFF